MTQGQQPNRREQILEKARGLLLTDDWKDVHIGRLANECSTSRVTIYKYFDSMDEITSEIQVRCLQKISAFNHLLNNSKLNGAEKLSLLFRGHHDYFQVVREELQFIALFEHYYQAGFPSKKLKTEHSKLLRKGNEVIHTIVIEGLQDGSLKSDLSPELLSIIISQSIYSLMLRMATQGDVITERWNVPSEDVVKHFAEFLFQSLTARTDAPIDISTEPIS